MGQTMIRIDEAFRYTAKEPQLPSMAPLLIVATSGSDWTGDCACPDRASALSGTPDQARSASEYQAATAFSHPLPGDFHLVLSPTAPHGPGVLNRAGWERWQGFCAPHPLRDPFDGELADQHLLHPLDAPLSPGCQTPPPRSPSGCTSRMPATSTAPIATCASPPRPWTKPLAAERCRRPFIRHNSTAFAG